MSDEPKMVDALFVGGPLHGTRRRIPDRDYEAIETRGAHVVLDEEWSATQVHYSARKVVREDGQNHYWLQRAWVDSRLGVGWIHHVTEAVVLAWFRNGRHATANGREL